MAKELRKPGLLEQLSTCRHSLGFYTAVCCAIQYHAPHESLSLSPSRLYAALRTVLSHRAPLSVSIVNESDPSATFVRLPEIDLRRVVKFEQLSPGAASDRLCALNTAIETRLRQRFDHLGELPLWRLLVLVPDPSDADQDPDVVLFIHHGIADGVSTILFQQDLRVALNKVDESNVADPVVVPPMLDFLPSLEDLHPLPVSYMALARALWKSWFPSSKKGHWTGANITHEEGACVHTRHVLHVLDAPTLVGLLSACKLRRMSLQPLLEALVARALFLALHDIGVPDHDAMKLACSCPINLRPFMRDLPAQTIGVFVASDEHEFRRDEDVWAAAARAKSSLAKALAGIDRHVNSGMLRFAGEIRTHFTRKLSTPRGESFEVSNVGAVDGGTKDGWIFRRVLITQSGSVAGAAIQFTVGSVKGGPMCIGAAWQAGVVEDKLVEKVFKYLDRLVQESATSA
ncbi:alcohol acetyltransferase [Vararia minispora EC-137]|uniref:Alcohol acetyltransferase n=1 Tax=Vararia minispora EC-137 TaxID=1314806 RepID=A0ACB8QV99_9AGAM|nr:alcohol acetyltransferase [Vararia minispora EC-137]